MFDFIGKAVSGAVNAIKNALGGGKKAPAPKPAPKPKSAPKSPITQIINGFNSFVSNPFKTVSQQKWLPKQVTNWAAQAAAARKAEEARQRALAEAARRKKQAELDKFRQKASQDVKKWVVGAKNWLDARNVKFDGKDWRKIYNTDGSYKVTGKTGNSWVDFAIGKAQQWFDPDVGKAKKAYNTWLKTSKDEAAVTQRAKNEYERVKEEYRQKSEKIVQNLQDDGKGNFFSFNWLTGGNQNNAREFAQKRLDELEKQQTKRYDDKLNAFLKEQAKRKAAIEKTKFSSRADFNKAVKSFSKWENGKISDLEYTRAATEGMYQGYGKKAKIENTSVLGTIGKAFNWVGNAITNNGLWQYTLGGGSKNVPSLVTAPSRGLTALSNLGRKKGEKIYTQDGKVVKYDGNAWATTYNQRNLNIAGREGYDVNTDINTSYQNAINLYKQHKTGNKYLNWYAGKLPTKKQWLDEKLDNGKSRYETYYTGKGLESAKDQAGMAGDTLEFLSDPLLYAGGVGLFGRASRGAKIVNSLTKSKKLSWVVNASKAVKESKTIKWLGAEYKTPQQKLGDALSVAKLKQRDVQQKLLPRIQAINSRLSKDKQLDTSILKDIDNLSDHEARILQRMVDGKFAFRDKLSLRDIRGLQYSKPTRDKLMDLYKRSTDFMEKIKTADNVGLTRTGRGGHFYAPNTTWLTRNGKTLDEFNFRLKKKRLTWKQPLTAKDLSQGHIDRYLVSNLDEFHRGSEAFRKSNLSKELSTLSKTYRSEMDAARSGVDDAFKATRTPGARIRKAIGAPTSLWKKSVLKYRPAWPVNNVLYNTQAAGLAGGSRALIEQARMLRPKNWRNAMQEIPDGVKADLTGELGGKGRLNRFYNNVENWSRVAAYRGAKANGYTDGEALKRVNKYLYDYKIRNWERPIRTAVPFYAWNKNLARAAVQMPLDRPLAAKAYNELDTYQQNQFENDFDKVVPQLKKLGYSDAEIDQIRQDQAKYFKGRLKVGNQYITTPFNAFSEKGLTSFGMNPYLSALGENATVTDSFGRPIRADEASLFNRVASKFPQYELGKKAYNSWRVAAGLDKPSKGWISEKGSEGYGLTKERQGYDSSKSNYDRSMDPRAKLGQDLLAFGGVPRGLDFSTKDLVERKRLQKLSEAYFALDTKNMSFDESEKARNALFKKYGVSADDFYKGLLSKYDTDNTKRIKGMKEDARAANKKLFDEYAAQPKGTRNIYAVNKLRQLNSEGYFNDNPFKRSFDWVTPDSVARASKQELYQKSKKTGDWSAWRKKYGDSRKYTPRARKNYQPSEKARIVQEALRTGDWTEYRKRYGSSNSHSPYRYDGKYFKSQKTMDRYKDGLFWRKYADATPEARRKLLTDNPKYNTRADWTDADWDKWKQEQKAALQKRARGFGNFATVERKAVSSNLSDAKRFRTKRRNQKEVKLTWLQRV